VRRASAGTTMREESLGAHFRGYSYPYPGGDRRSWIDLTGRFLARLLTFTIFRVSRAQGALPPCTPRKAIEKHKGDSQPRI